MRVSRRGSAVIIGLLLSSAVAEPLGAGVTQTSMGAWEAPIRMPGVGIHATLLPTGEVLMYDYVREHQGTEAWLLDPGDRSIVDVSLDRRRDIFCSGHSLLPDGRVLVTGGTVYQSPHERGVARTDIFDPFSRTWSSGPKMGYKRWYPSNLTLADGRTLIVSGQEHESRIIRRHEIYDPETNTIVPMPPSADRRFAPYTSLHLLPSGQVLKTVNEREAHLLDLETARWSHLATIEGPSRYAGNSVLLPGLDRVLVVGGGGSSGGTTDARILDLNADIPEWERVSPMRFERSHSNAVILPDATVLVVGGNNKEEYLSPQKSPELYDPVTDTWATMAPQQAPRGYHSTALLLPDGSVLSAGADNGRMQKTAEIYHPPYFFDSDRPVIGSAPSEISYGDEFELEVSEPISRVALVRLGSVTHATAFDQRYVDLAFVAGEGPNTVTAPPTPTVAPPGYYMAFVLDADGVPSEAALVLLG
jgi:hypothetical protein